MYFRQTFIVGALWDKDELVRFWGQNVKGQGHIIAAEASSTRRCRRVKPSFWFLLAVSLSADLIQTSVTS